LDRAGGRNLPLEKKYENKFKLIIKNIINFKKQEHDLTYTYGQTEKDFYENHIKDVIGE